jgi:NAD(P)-dependent dehydrogenase (short-subunit alcohol dehydrogenase family)
VSAPVDAKSILRSGLLEGVSILCAGEHGPLGEEVAQACAELGASVSSWRPGSERVPADLLCYDGASTFEAAADEREALDGCLELAWEATRSVLAAPLLEEHRGDGAGGDAVEAERAYPARVVYLAPRAGSGGFARAAGAGLENLARTLSIEWARYGVSTVAIAPGAAAAGEVGALVAYLASPAGGYFSGCLLDLSGPAVSLRS